MTGELFVWTTMLWALIVGWSGAKVVWHLMSLPDYGGRGSWLPFTGSRGSASAD